MEAMRVPDATEAHFIIAQMRRAAVDGKMYVSQSRYRYLYELIWAVERCYPQNVQLKPIDDLGPIEVIIT